MDAATATRSTGAGDDLDDVLAAATVLIADDHHPNLALLQQVLAKAGTRSIHVTTDPTAVVGLCRELRPDIVLLDLHMPGMDGVEVMAAIRAATTGGEFLPVIVITADATTDARDRVLASGANDFLTKPIDRNEVVLRTRNLLHTRALHRVVHEHNTRL